MNDFLDEREGGVLKLSGDLTIQNAARLRMVLLDALKAGELRLDLSAVTRADVSGLQLLCSAHMTSCSSVSKFLLAGSLSEALGEAAARAGFARLDSCPFTASSPCLWSGGKADE
jgi:anti-anti-sigma regulatory factor